MDIVKDLTPYNHHRGRTSSAGVTWDPDAIVIHVMQGTMEATRSWFFTDASDVSSTYGISKTGKIVQYVEEDDTHAANGILVNPTAEIVLERRGVNPNLYTLSIEHEGTGREDLTDDQRAASAWLIADIAKRRPKIKFTQRHIFGHHSIRANKDCPGAINVPKLIAAAQAAYGPAAPTVDYPRAVWSAYFQKTTGDGWLIVTKRVTDSDWEFVPLANLRAIPLRAETPLSQMPLRP